jgi:hypothetical protein
MHINGEPNNFPSGEGRSRLVLATTAAATALGVLLSPAAPAMADTGNRAGLECTYSEPGGYERPCTEEEWAQAGYPSMTAPRSSIGDRRSTNTGGCTKLQQWSRKCSPASGTSGSSDESGQQTYIGSYQPFPKYGAAPEQGSGTQNQYQAGEFASGILTGTEADGSNNSGQYVQETLNGGNTGRRGLCRIFSYFCDDPSSRSSPTNPHPW